MFLSILLPAIFALFAIYKRKITIPGIILAFSLGVIICYYGGYFAFSALALLFILTVLSDAIKKTKKDKQRNIIQIISNILTSAVAILLFDLTKQELFYIIYYCVIAGSLADTFASSIGTLSTKGPVNIFTLKKLNKGESGAVSLLGLFASLLGGIIIGSIYLIHKMNLISFIIIALMGLVGSLIDSILGAIFEIKYICFVCNEITDEKTHCVKSTSKLRGYTLINNNMVNFLSNVVVFIIAYIILK